MINSSNLNIFNYKKISLYILTLGGFFIFPGLAKADVNISSCGVLDQAGETYVLTQDVSSAGTCFAIAANNVILDLNGHTVTYNTSAGDLRYGIAMPPGYATDITRANFPGLPDSAFGGGSNAIIRNGTITQGAGNGNNSHAIYGRLGTEIYNTTTTVSGDDTDNIYFVWSRDLKIHDNTLYNNSTVVTNRHQGKGVIESLRDSGNTKIYNNTIVGGPQWGIRVSHNSGGETGFEVYNNTISQNARVANPYGIGAHADNMLVYNNTVTPSNGRGIHVTQDNIQVYNNTVTVKEGSNGEYAGGWTHGIKLEEATNAKVYNNNVTALAGVDGAGHGYALDISQQAQLPGNNEIYDNVFTAITASSNSIAAAIHLVGVSAGNNLNIHDNDFYTNDYGAYFDWDSGSDLVLRSNTFQLTGTPFTPQLVYFNTGTQDSVNNIFLDTTLGSGLSYDDIAYRTSGADFSLDIQEYLNISVQNSQGSALSGANVSVRDQSNNLVASGVTNSSGNLTLTITTDTYAGKPYEYTSFDSHSILVNISGYNNQTVSANVSQIQDILITMIPGDDDQPQSCVASWTCGAWSQCSGGTQSRTCNDTNSCGDNSSRPTQSQSCTVDNGGDQPQSCVASWTCGAWSQCSGGTQSRTCTDTNSCGDNSSRPTQSQSCTVDSGSNDSSGSGSSGSSGNTSGGDTSNNDSNRPNDNSNLACRNCSYNRGSLLVLKNTRGGAVYHIGRDGKKYVFPDSKTYFSWYGNFSTVKQVDLTDLDDYPDGGVIPYRAGTKLITHQNTARVYAVEPGGIIRWIPNETIARNLFGDNWQSRVRDVIPGYFSISYTLGDSLSTKLPTGVIVKDKNGLYYYIHQGQKRRFSSLNVLTQNGFNIEDLIISSSDLSDYSNGLDITTYDDNIATIN